ncbi:hypothetical protein BYT27DRAFT_7197332 [Phlegmacium glaucopus]|nr:hypothetical protein BYT27DRAFT_7197332 [Phlegmacium glaucopus]
MMGPNDYTKGKGRRNSQSSEIRGSGSGSGNTQATSSNTAPAMFDSTTNPTITGGHFDAHEGDRTSVTININASRIPRTSGGLAQIRNQPSADNMAPNSETNPNRNRRRRRPKNAQENIQRSNEIYERHLMLKGRGFPLWIPQANIHLPVPYRAKGVCIGDVGIITAFGGFDFLFNICRARDDPINPDDLPDNFAPIHPPLVNMTDVRNFREFSAGSYLASSSIVKSQTAEQTPGLIFESSASEGAILTMPDGAFQEELGNLSKFRDYVAVHATDWYKFANGPRGREARNGDVRVVVGCDKTTSWGMATFANTSSAQQSKFRLKFHPLGGQQQPQRSGYAWEHSGVAEVRVGPEPGENEELGEVPTCQLRNQCLFMRTLTVTLSDSVWAETFPGTVSAINQEGSQPEYHGPSNTNTTAPHSSSSCPAESNQGRQICPGPSESEVAEQEDNDNEEGSTPIQVPWDSPSSASSSPRHHVGPGSPTSDTHDSDDIVPEKRLVPTTFVDKLYQIICGLSPRIWDYLVIRWSRDERESFTIWDVGRFTKLVESHFRYNTFSRFVHELNMYDFEIRPPTEYDSYQPHWKFFHPKFKLGRPDLLHEMKRKPFELHCNPVMKDKLEILGDLGHAPAQLGAMQNGDMRIWDVSDLQRVLLISHFSQEPFQDHQ